jgi:hypothetical protein
MRHIQRTFLFEGLLGQAKDLAALLNMYIELDVREKVSPCNSLMSRLRKIVRLE